MNSAMVVTEPLSQDLWDEPRLGRPTSFWVTLANAYFYAQRTADGRIALGGRGRPVPLRFGHGRRRDHPSVDDPVP